ncbi:MAG: hypothetical protein ACYTHM_02160 [Planctomycetota bacterium]|jgi:hypothetical protein
MAPIGAAVIFWRQGDFFGIAFAFGWLATNFFEVGVYMADAAVQALPLVSPFTANPQHDWTYIFTRMGLLRQSAGIGMLVKLLATGTMVAAIGWGGWLVWRMVQSRGQETAPRES